MLPASLHGSSSLRGLLWCALAGLGVLSLVSSLTHFVMVLPERIPPAVLVSLTAWGAPIVVVITWLMLTGASWKDWLFVLAGPALFAFQNLALPLILYRDEPTYEAKLEKMNAPGMPNSKDAGLAYRWRPCRRAYAWRHRLLY
jgi:hypothetical protein